MYRTHREMSDFRDTCGWRTIIDFWELYENLETNDDEYNTPLYEKIEEGLEDWIKRNTKKNIYYAGDLRFEFESEEERDRFDKECGDPLAFKLIYA